MLTDNQIKEIREHLNNAQNPVFFFDNDPDGLCSFLLLQRYIERGKGVAVKSYPEMNASYFRKVSELKADYVFILDKPVVGIDFFSEAAEKNIPVVWIDHHDNSHSTASANVLELPENVYYYNPIFNTPSSSEPTTSLCYQVISEGRKKEDLWVAVVGCVADWNVPNFYKHLKDTYPELYINASEAPEILFNSEIGKIVRMLSFGLKDSTTNVVNMLKYLMKVKSPQDILVENAKNRAMHEKFENINKKYLKFFEKAREIGNSLGKRKMLFFQYGGDLSISSDISNELRYNFPNKVIVVAYMKGAKANISVRGDKIRAATLRAISELEGATAGGHEDATGAKVNIEDLEKFRERLEREIID